ncbi:unnamed protein product [Sympodiomycopsis kandeliae]
MIRFQLKHEARMFIEDSATKEGQDSDSNFLKGFKNPSLGSRSWLVTIFSPLTGNFERPPFDLNENSPAAPVVAAFSDLMRCVAPNGDQLSKRQLGWLFEGSERPETQPPSWLLPNTRALQPAGPQKDRFYMSAPQFPGAKRFKIEIPARLVLDPFLACVTGDKGLKIQFDLGVVGAAKLSDLHFKV